MDNRITFEQVGIEGLENYDFFLVKELTNNNLYVQNYFSKEKVKLPVTKKLKELSLKEESILMTYKNKQQIIKNNDTELQKFREFIFLERLVIGKRITINEAVRLAQRELETFFNLTDTVLFKKIASFYKFKEYQIVYKSKPLNYLIDSKKEELLTLQRRINQILGLKIKFQYAGFETWKTSRYLTENMRNRLIDLIKKN
jgi:hypothetical protein